MVAKNKLFNISYNKKIANDDQIKRDLARKYN